MNNNTLTYILCVYLGFLATTWVHNATLVSVPDGMLATLHSRIDGTIVDVRGPGCHYVPLSKVKQWNDMRYTRKRSYYDVTSRRWEAL